MSYARSRLWLGIITVGTIVLCALCFILAGIPDQIFPSAQSWHRADFLSLSVFLACFALLMLPFDFLGGWVFPVRYHRQKLGFFSYFLQWLRATASQTLLYFVVSLSLLFIGRIAGIWGSLGLVLVIGVLILALQEYLARIWANHIFDLGKAIPQDVTQKLADLRLNETNCIVVEHSDPGFTGGVLGLPGKEVIIVPSRWLLLTHSQLAAVIARRVEAVRSGSRWGGIVVAFAWILIGFYLSSLLPGAGVKSVAEIVTLYCGFTLWSFLGLLLLPTLSRYSSLAIDHLVVTRGVNKEALEQAILRLDQFQDDEPERASLIETIFHPVPSVGIRIRKSRISGVRAWHCARMTLFLSWACAGLLSRAVHCNVGRPELWVMLPTD